MSKRTQEKTGNNSSCNPVHRLGLNEPDHKIQNSTNEITIPTLGYQHL